MNLQEIKAMLINKYKFEESEQNMLEDLKEELYLDADYFMSLEMKDKENIKTLLKNFNIELKNVHADYIFLEVDKIKGVDKFLVQTRGFVPNRLVMEIESLLENKMWTYKDREN